jgi:putative transposase
MFTRFSRKALDDLLEKFPLLQEGREYLDAALKAPSRNVRGTTTSMISDNPCPKMMCNVQAESDTAEGRAALNYLFDHDVIGYLDQPPALEIDYIGRNGRRVRTHTTPDFLVIRRSSGFCIDEWKVATDRTVLPEKNVGRYITTAEGTVDAPPVREAAEVLGFQFAVRFSDEIPLNRTLNQRFLLSYLYEEAERLYQPRLSAVLKPFKDNAFLTYEDALGNYGVDSDLINWAVAMGHLTIDWDHICMSQPNEVILFRDQQSLHAYRLLRDPERMQASGNKFDKNKFRIGQIFVFDGIRFVVNLVGQTNLYATSERNESFTKPWQFIETAYLSNELQVELDESSDFAVSASRLKSASPLAITRAIKRLEILEKLDRGDRLQIDERHSDRSYRRWKKGVDAALAAGLSRIEGVLESNDQGFYGTHIDPGLSKLINAAIENLLKSTVRPNINKMFSAVKKTVEACGKSMIAKSSFYERVIKIRSLSTIRESEGQKVAYQLEPTYWQLGLNTPVHCERPFEMVHIDHTLLDNRLDSSLSGEGMPRPWLTLAVDACSRRVLGFYLSYHPPSYISVMMVLLDIFQRFGRKPDSIITDWGAEFHAKDLKQLCTALGIRKITRPKSAAKFGNCVERLFGVTQSELTSNLRGNTKATKKVRTLTKQVDPSTHAGLTMADLYYGLEVFFFDIYDDRKHPTLLRTPRAFFGSARITAGARLHQLVKIDEILPILLPTVRGGTRVIDFSRGVYVNYEYYGNISLADLSLNTTRVPVKLCPFHPGLVMAYVKKQWIACKSKWHDELQAVPEFIRRSVFEECLLEKRMVSADKDWTDRKVLDLIEQLNELAIANKDYWKDKDTRQLASLFGSVVGKTSVESPPSSKPQTDLDNLFSQAIQKAKERNDYGQIVG